MTKLLLRFPWFISAPAVLVVAVAFAAVAYYLAGDYFNEECRNERNLLTGQFEASNCGEGAKVAKTQREAALQPGTGAPAAAATTAATPPAATTPGAAATPTTPASQSGVVAQGSFRDGAPGHTGSGVAQVQRLADGSLNLFLSNFQVTNGPDLFVVLSREAGGGRDSAAAGTTLGALKANNGNQNYTIPAGTDVSLFRSVIIYCRSFATVFAYATIEAAP